MSKAERIKKLSKKETQKIIFEKLSGAMAEYKNTVKEKKLLNNLKKISKLFAADIVKASVKQKAGIKKTKNKAVHTKREEDSEAQPTT